MCSDHTACSIGTVFRRMMISILCKHLRFILTHFIPLLPFISSFSIMSLETIGWVKYARILGFFDPYFIVWRQNLWFCRHTVKYESEKTRILVCFMQSIVFSNIIQNNDGKVHKTSMDAFVCVFNSVCVYTAIFDLKCIESMLSLLLLEINRSLSYKDVFRTMSNIYDGVLCVNS